MSVNILNEWLEMPNKIKRAEILWKNITIFYFLTEEEAYVRE